jgi:ribosomal RNA-processing protein 17
VTIETVDITRDGFQKVADANTSGGDEDDEPQAEGAQAITGTTNKGKPVKGKRIWTKERPEGPKKKKKKFRYESKAERKLTRYKERSKNKAQAKSRKE